MPKRNVTLERAHAPQLDPRSLPSQERGRSTFEIIILTTGELLGEVGFERLTTNLVCERAGLTPPALYRYFPNKYAILAELARRLMDEQDQLFLAYLNSEAAQSRNLEGALRASISLRRDIVSATKAHPGGMWILRAIRAIPELHHVRSLSRDMVVERHVDVLKAQNSQVSEERLRTAARLSEQVGYAVIEMLVEDPDLDEARVIEETSLMTCLYFGRVLSWDDSAVDTEPKAAANRLSRANLRRVSYRKTRIPRIKVLR